MKPGDQGREIRIGTVLRSGVGPSAAIGCLAGDRAWQALGGLSRSLAALLAIVLSVTGLVAIAIGSRAGPGAHDTASAPSAGGVPSKASARVRVFSRSLVVLCAIAVVFSIRAASTRSGVEQSVTASLAGSNVWIAAQGSVLAEPTRNRSSIRFVIRLSHLQVRGSEIATREHLAVTLPAGVLRKSHREAADPARILTPGTVISAEGYLKQTPPEWRDRALRNRSLARLNARDIETLRAPPRWLALTTKAREFLRSGAEPALGPERSGLLLGLMYGDTSGIGHETEVQFRRAGLSHLTAVSGQNFALVIAVVSLILKMIPPIWERRKLTVSVLALAAVGFIVMTRWEPSVLRAGAMALVVLAAWLGGIRLKFGELLSVAVAMALAVDPMLLFSLGFQLSVAAAFSIAMLAPSIGQFISRLTRLPRIVALPAAVAVAAEAGVAPLIAANFGTVQVLSIPSNILAVPAAGFASVWGYVACSTTALVPLASSVVHLGTRIPLAWSAGIASVVGGASFAELNTGKLPWPGVIGCYACLGYWAARMSRRVHRDSQDPAGRA